MKLRINYPVVIIVLYYIVSTSFFALIDGELTRVAGFKIVDLFSMGMVVPITLLYYYKKIEIPLHPIVLMLFFWFLYIMMETFIRSIMIDNVPLGYAIRSIRVYMYLLVFLIAIITPAFTDAKKLIVVIVWLDFLSSILFNIQFASGVHILKGHVLEGFQVGGFTFIRGYTGTPLMFVFDLCALFFLKDEIVITKSRLLRVIMGASIAVSCMATLTRGIYLVVILAVSVFVFTTYVKKINLRSLLIITVYVSIMAAVILSSVVKDMAVSVQEELLEEKGSNILLRVNMLLERYEYIKEEKQLLFGIGPKSDSDPNVTIIFQHGVDSQKGIVTDDIGVAGFILQYGLAGILLYFVVFLTAVVIPYRTDKKLMFAIKMQIIVYLILFFESGSLNYEKILFVMGVLLAVATRNKIQDTHLISESTPTEVGPENAMEGLR